MRTGTSTSYACISEEPCAHIARALSAFDLSLRDPTFVGDTIHREHSPPQR